MNPERFLQAVRSPFMRSAYIAGILLLVLGMLLKDLGFWSVGSFVSFLGLAYIGWNLYLRYTDKQEKS